MNNYIWSKSTIGYFLSIESFLPPTIANVNDERWMVFTGDNGGWFRIDSSVTLDMVQNRWIKWESKKETDTHAPQAEWKIPGSKGNEYTVSHKNGQWSCECVGFGFRRKCKHVEKAKEGLTIC